MVRLWCDTCQASGPACATEKLAAEHWNQRTLGRSELVDTIPAPPEEEPEEEDARLIEEERAYQIGVNRRAADREIENRPYAAAPEDFKFCESPVPERPDISCTYPLNHKGKHSYE